MLLSFHDYDSLCVLDLPFLLELLRYIPAQYFFIHFLRRGKRQSAHQFKALRQEKHPCSETFQKGDHLVEAQSFSRLQHDIGTGALTESWVGHANDRRLLHAGMLVK